MKSHALKVTCLIAIIIGAFATGGSAQTPIVLFQDGFENTAVGEPPATNSPAVGSYSFAGSPAGTVTNEHLSVVTGPIAGGPSSAVEGTNYLEYNAGSSGPLVQALFATPYYATNAPFHVSFYKWRPITTGYPQMILGRGTAVNSLVQLVYTTDWPSTLAWRWYNGSYHDSGLLFTTNNWDFVEMDFDGTNLTGRVNGGSPLPLGLYGGSDKQMDRLLFRLGAANTIFYLDDIKVTTTAPVMVRSIQPAPNATGVSRQPVVEVQLADVTQSVQTGTIHLFFNGTEVTPTVTQAMSSGVNVTTITYSPPASLPYNSTNTVTCNYSDNATPANLYSRTWTFTVYSGDPIFADNFDSSIQSPVLPPVQLTAFEGANCLRMARIGSGRPALQAVGDLSKTSVSNDLISLTLAFAPVMNLGQDGVIGVFPGYATETNGQIAFNQTGQINLFDDGRISIVDITGKVNQYLTQTLTSNAWNTIEIQYANGSGQWYVSANGAPFESYFGKSSQGGTAYDNVNGFTLSTTGTGYMWVDALAVSNATANTLLFSDGFENGVVGDPPVTNSPTVGTYSIVDPGTVDGGLLVTDGVNGTNYVDAPPNAPQVGTYDTDATTALAFTGAHHGGAKSLDLYQGNAHMVFTAPIPAGILLHAEAYINWQAGNVAWGFTTTGTNEFARVTLNDTYGITVFDGASEVDSGFGHTTSVWEKYELDYVVGASSITLTVNGNPVAITIPSQTSISGLFFSEDDATSSKAYVDDVRATARLGDIPATNPFLDATQSGDQLILSWTNAAGYVLQQNSDLGNPNGWVNVPGGGVSPVQVPIGAPAQFYRLAKPL